MMKHVLFAACIGTICSFSAFAGVELISEQQCQIMYDKGILSANAPVKCNRLANVTIQHYDFDGQIRKGTIVVMDAVANRVDRIFQTLLEKKVPMHSVMPMEKFNGDDNASMVANNTSAFNARPIIGGVSWSKHAYGLAIDLNPEQNPFVSIDENNSVTVRPVQSTKTFLNRYTYRPAKPVRTGMAEEVIDVFAENGFLIWGGYWNYPIDFQHFEIGPQALVNRLATEPDKIKAQNVFEEYIADYLHCMKTSDQKKHEEKRMSCVQKITKKFSQ